MMISDNSKCTGCTACYEICPQNCISLKKNDEGFIFPEVDITNCINCGLCEKVCLINNINYNNETEDVYAYISSNDFVRQKSTSGGFFSNISEWVIKHNGVVYGAVFDQNFHVKHIFATDIKDRDRMRTSKYVQSDLNGVFKKIYNDLCSHKYVLFSGTPCQVEGLNKFLLYKKIDTSTLITCDFICHGVPSPLIWDNYLKTISEKYHDEIKNINFRDKRYGWDKPVLNIQFKNRSQCLDERKDPFYLLFYSNCIMRESCYSCKFSKTTRVADITMGDCWGINNYYPEEDDNKGISLLMINTLKGKKVFEKISRGDQIKKITLQNVTQPHLYSSVKKPKNREKFWSDYEKYGFNYVLKRYTNFSIVNKMKNYIKGFLKRFLI